MALAGMRADMPIYLFVLIYTFLGIWFLVLTNAVDRAAFAVYLGRWPVLFGLLLPALAILLDTLLLVHRFDRRRSLAARRIFSARRLAKLLSGIALLEVMFLFQCTFTSVKNALPVWWSGFPYDKIQADFDRILHFGYDPWVWLYSVAAYDWVRLIVEWNYNILWFVLCYSALFYVVTSPRAAGVRTRYIVSFMVVWILIGNVLAGMFMSAGPAFYGLVTGDTARFAEQLGFLARGADSGNSAASYQNYLWTLHSSGLPGFGSGISAFPSVHVGLITLNALFLFEYDRKWGTAAFVYVGFVVASSVYLAWHYAIDGYAAIAVTLAIYMVGRKLPGWVSRLTDRPEPDAVFLSSQNAPRP